MKSIIFIHLFNDRSGSPKVLSQSISALRKHGFQAELLTSSHTDGFLTNVADKQHVLFYRRSENKIITLLYYLISQTLLFFQCLRYWNKDVVFYVNTMMPFGAALAGKLLGKKVYWHIHETSIRPKLLKQFLRFMIHLTADKIIFVSKYLQDTESFQNKNQIVIYNAIETQSQIFAKKHHTGFNVLMICSLKKYKGVFEFIALAKLLSSHNDIAFTLVLNAESYEINDYFKNVSIPSNVVILPRQQNVGQFYEQADLLLNLSRPDEWIETFGLTILEGMAYGLPVVAPPVGGPGEIIREGLEGFLISSYQVDEIADKILYLSNNPTEYEKLSANTLQRVNDFNEKEFENKIVNIFEEEK